MCDGGETADNLLSGYTGQPAIYAITVMPAILSVSFVCNPLFQGEQAVWLALLHCSMN